MSESLADGWNREFRTFFKSPNIIQDKEFPKKAFGAPLMVWESQTHEALDRSKNLHCFDALRMPRMPFDIVRVDATIKCVEKTGAVGSKRIKAILTKNHRGGFEAFIYGSIPLESGEVWNTYVSALVVPDQTPEADWGRSTALAFYSAKNLKETKIEQSDPAWERNRNFFLNWVDSFCVDFMNPHFHLAKVCPPINSRSIIWERQNSHYVLIHKTHPANNSEASSGTRFAEPQIERMAHSRRAHFRLLKSPKFKNKVGQRIFIKSAWVGPKEWCGFSGQVYKLADDLKLNA